MDQNILIVGQGLLGTLLGSVLDDLQIKFQIIDQLRPYAASRLAAGIIHPISGRRYVKSWNYDQLETEFKACYTRIEAKLNSKFLYDHNVLLAVNSIKEENDLMSQANRYAYEQLIHPFELDQDILSPGLRGVYAVKSYRLDILLLLDLFRSVWLASGYLNDTAFEYQNLKYSADVWHYNDQTFSHVVFCEGAAVVNNPFFKNIPIVPNKGQMMWIESEGWSSQHTLKHQLMVSGYGQKHWVGATYEWDYNQVEPTPEGQAVLVNQLNKMLKGNYRIISQHAGLRPTVSDRKPIITCHADHHNMWSINGLGTKGSSMAPYVVNRFIDLLAHPDSKNEFGINRLFK